MCQPQQPSEIALDLSLFLRFPTPDEKHLYADRRLTLEQHNRQVRLTEMSRQRDREAFQDR